MASCWSFPTEVTRRLANDTLYSSVTHWPCSHHRLGQYGSVHGCFSWFSKVILFQNRQQILQNWRQKCKQRLQARKLHLQTLERSYIKDSFPLPCIRIIDWNIWLLCSGETYHFSAAPWPWTTHHGHSCCFLSRADRWTQRSPPTYKQWKTQNL